MEEIFMATRTINGVTLALIRGNIVEVHADAIANAANSGLRGGGGVDGAIHRAAGPTLLDELVKRYPNGTPTGTAVETRAHRLPAKWVLHAVGPVWRGGSRGEAEHLAGAYRSCLELCDALGARSVAFPAISMGIYGYPGSQGARVAVQTAAEHLRTETSLELVRFVLYSDETWALFDAAMAAVAQE